MTTTTPSDAELDAMIAEYRERIYPQDMQPRFERAIMRAVLAKWGAPASGEPVAWLVYLPDEEAQRIYDDQEDPGYVDDLTNHANAQVTPLYTAPQPVEREPLTLAEVEQLIAQHDYAIHGDRGRYLVRMTERAHGIGTK